MSQEMDLLNPEVREIPIGIRDLRNLKIYPMSVKQQLNFSSQLTTGIQAFFSGTAADAEVVGLIMKLIEDNIPVLLGFIVDKEEDPDELLDNMTNYQLTYIALQVFEMNYEGAIKNVKSLLEKISPASPSGRQLPTSVKNTPDIPSETSNEISKTEE